MSREKLTDVDPVDDRLVIDAEHAPDAAEVRAFEVEAHPFALGLFRVAERLRVGVVEVPTLSALMASAAGAGMAGFSLLL
jgi:hypothetical protein